MNLLAMAHGLAMALWVGGMVLATVVVTPTVFKVLPPEETGRFLSVFFPRYYLFGAICGVVALATLLSLLVNRHFLLSSLLREGAVALQLLLTLYAGYGLHPKIRKLKSIMRSPTATATEKVEAQNRFVRLHQQSVRVNAVVLLIGLGMTGWILRHG